MSRFSGKLVVDGTYVPVKGYERDIPLLWGCDYDSHDFPHSMLAPSENYHSWYSFFASLKNIGYPLFYLVCDDNNNIKRAATYHYPNVVIQTCLKHYLDNIQSDLNIKSSSKYRHFYDVIYEIIYEKRYCEPEIVREMFKIYPIFKDDQKQLNWLTNIMNDRFQLTNYHLFENCPNTTNIIEGFNGHFKDRADNIRGFKSFHSAKYWLNSYVILRRVRNFKACGGKFKHLNGKSPIQNTLKREVKIPDFF